MIEVHESEVIGLFMPPTAHLATASAPIAPAPTGPGDRDAAGEEQKRSFLRMVSHELRTPLNSILGFSEILACELYGPLGSPQYREYAEIIRGSGHKLLKLVNQVLELARLEGRNMDMDLRCEPLEAAIDDALDGLRDEMAARKVTALVARRGALPAVTADFRGLRTVLAALFQNALTFSPEGGQVRVRAESRGRFVDIWIEDDGAGVDPDELPRLMLPFQQGENALIRRTEGAGLGLPISSLTCQAMNGRLILSCAPGHGLTARIRLPAA